MTDPTGRSFLSYRRVRKDEAALLIQAQHDHGVPTWQDVQNLDSVPTEDELRRVLADATTASAVLFITPEVEDSAIIRDVEVPKVMKRVEARNGFFAVPCAAGGLDYAKAAEVTSNHLSAQNLVDWNMEMLATPTISYEDAAGIAGRVLAQRIRAIDAHLPAGEPLKCGFFVRRPAPFQLGAALTVDWSERFKEKEALSDTWRNVLLPALARVADAVRLYAPGREVHAFGLPTLPAAAALGCAFVATSGSRLAWRQYTPGQPEQLWSLQAERTATGFLPNIYSKDPKGRDIAVLVSVADDVEPVFASCQQMLPPLRALVHVSTSAKLPYSIASPGHALDIARIVEQGLRTARREYGAVGTIHLFMAVPAGLAVLVGQLLNTFGLVQTYEHVSVDGSGCYRQGPMLYPCS